MSGVNAHAIFGSTNSVSKDAAKVAAPLRRQRFWPFPWPQLFAASTKCSLARAAFVTDLRMANLSYLHDHQVHFLEGLVDCSKVYECQLLQENKSL